MTTSINTNVSAYFAQSNLRSAGMDSQSSIGRLSSGNKIIRAADDVAGLSVGTVIRTAVNTLKAAYGNTQQANSLLQVADGGLANITEILQRQKSLATQATAGTLSNAERGFLNQEFQNLTSEINRLVDNTKFNQVVLLDGSLTGTQANQMVETAARAATITAGFGAAVGVQPIDFFRLNAGAYANISGTAAGNIAFVASDGTTQLTNAQYASVPENINGPVGQIELVEFTANVSATLRVNIGGTVFEGTSADNSATFVLRNGETRLLFRAAAALQWDNQATAETSVQTLNNVANFGQIEIARTYAVEGFDTVGTQLEGAVTTPLLRLSDPSDMSIKNFRYAGGATGANILQVDIGGRTFTATGIANDPGVAIQFTNGNDVLRLDLTAMTAAPNIFGNLTDRQNFIDALNKSFSNAQGALTFQTGTAVDDAISVAIRGVNSQQLFGGALSIGTVADATVAGAKLDEAIAYVTSVRADVGALQSRFDYAAANIQTSIQNQDAARGQFLDADISEESTNFASSQVLMQASISVLAQANQLPQNLLKLIG